MGAHARLHAQTSRLTRVALRRAKLMTAGALALAVCICAPARAQDTQAPPQAPPQSSPQAAEKAAEEPASVEAFGEGDRACLEWGDGCRVCARDAPGAPARCSTPGPVCQPAAIACARR